MVALPGTTAEDILLFGKNSDRQRNEAQTVEYFPSADHEAGSAVACTYVSIPQVRHTHAVLLSRPFWIWGAEMGANEHGVVIGNEGLLARIRPPEEEALTGMDLLRLALERAATATDAVDVITTLLDRYGQGGNCGHLTPSYYHNGFLIADPTDAFVLETVGREWFAERIRGIRAISNVYSVGPDVERTSARVPELLRDLGCTAPPPTRYADLIADPYTSHVGSAPGRRARATSLLGSGKGQLRVANIMSTLRDHDPSGSAETEWDPRRPLKYSLCIHAGPMERSSQTTAAMASEVRVKNSVHWLTATAAPCISIFKPMLMDVPLPSHGPRPSDRFDESALWWRHERLHRAALLGHFPTFLAEIREERDMLEADFRARVRIVLTGGSLEERSRVVTQCWKDAVEMEDRWYARMSRAQVANDSDYVAAWTEMNRLAGYNPK